VESIGEEKMATKLSSKKVIDFVNKLSKNLEHSHIELSSIINGYPPPIWWFTINNDKFNSDVYLLLKDQYRKILYYFFIKSGSIKEPERLFEQKKGNMSSVKIHIGDEHFADTLGTGFKFKKYLKAEIKYTKLEES